MGVKQSKPVMIEKSFHLHSTDRCVVGVTQSKPVMIRKPFDLHHFDNCTVNVQQYHIMHLLFYATLMAAKWRLIE